MSRSSSLTDNDRDDRVPDSVRDLFEELRAGGMTPVEARDFFVSIVEYARKNNGIGGLVAEARSIAFRMQESEDLEDA